MPLLDHFRPPLSERRHWGAFHSRWASAIADELNDRGLPEHLFAEPTVNLGGQAQIDVGTFDELGSSPNEGVGVGTLSALAAPTWVIPAVFPETFEVQVIHRESGPRLVAAIELVSPSNKDRPETRRAFAVKCASYLNQGVAVIVVDVVTSRAANLHNEILDVMQVPGSRMASDVAIYGNAYRPIRRDGDGIEIWAEVLRIGDALPRLPLYLDSESFVAIEFESNYQETCDRLRL